jgi:hypothetical protein
LFTQIGKQLKEPFLLIFFRVVHHILQKLLQQASKLPAGRVAFLYEILAIDRKLL